MLKTTILIISILLLVSCGGGSSHEPREEKSIYFIGSSPINGIEYQCGERMGVSKSNEISDGVITCVYSPLYLTLGKLKLGMVESLADRQKIYPQTLVESFDGNFNNEKLLKITILLESLDDKSSDKHITIPQSIKDKISITSLNDITIEELYKEIRDMGITPITKEEAKIHLILNSSNVHSGKPSIKAFEEDIALALNVGSTIGKLSIDEGDGTLIYPFTLSGEGKEYFTINREGSLRLVKSLDEIRTYQLKVTVANEFGYTEQNITLHIEDSQKIGKVQMESLFKATINIFQLKKDGTKELIDTTQTKSTGTVNQIANFDLKPELLEEQKFYLYEANIEDKNRTKIGKLRLISKGIWIKNSMYKIRITPLSEILSTYIVKHSQFDKLEERLNRYSKILLKESLDDNSDIEAKDIIIFNPLRDKNSLYPTLKYNHTYQTITDKIRDNDMSYKEKIFSAYIVNSFQSNAIEIVGAYIYTIDMLYSGKFRIYDFETSEVIGSLKLPNTPYERDSHVIYVNLIGNSVRVGSLEELSYIINIKNQKRPFLEKEPFIIYSILSGNFSLVAIGRSNNQNIFSKERALYFYDISLNENKTKKIKFFNITEDDDILQYEFDSKLTEINSLWSYKNYLYVVGDKKLHIFMRGSNQMTLDTICNTIEVEGNILGVEKDILYILNKQELTLIDIKSNKNPKFIEKITVPFEYKLGIKTNGEYITTGSEIIDIKTLQAISTQTSKLNQLKR